jgi:hypothetical protein
MADIKSWTEKKKVTLKVLNRKIDFMEFEPNAVRENEVYVPSVPLIDGKYADTGHRFRFNQFNRVDSWFISLDEVEPFYDYMFFSNDVFDVDEDNTVLAELYFRLSVD